MEKDLTKKVIKIIKDVDKTVQEVEKGIGSVIAGIAELKGMLPKDDSDKPKE
jgi:hypothetical protein